MSALHGQRPAAFLTALLALVQLPLKIRIEPLPALEPSSTSM